MVLLVGRNPVYISDSILAGPRVDEPHNSSGLFFLNDNTACMFKGVTPCCRGCLITVRTCSTCSSNVRLKTITSSR